MGGSLVADSKGAQAPLDTELQETMAEFGEASIDLIAWELGFPTIALVPAWRRAVRSGLIEPTSLCPETGELMYRLVPAADHDD